MNSLVRMSKLIGKERTVEEKEDERNRKQMIRRTGYKKKNRLMINRRNDDCAPKRIREMDTMVLRETTKYTSCNCSICVQYIELVIESRRFSTIPVTQFEKKKSI